MLRILSQTLRNGLATEPVPAVDDPAVDDQVLGELGITLQRRIDARLGRSLAIRQVDAGSCNGCCGLEIHALNNLFCQREIGDHK